jgi:hypothetical protein
MPEVRARVAALQYRTVRSHQASFMPNRRSAFAAQNCDLLLVGEAGGCEDVVDRMPFPGDRTVGAQHDLAGADLRHQVPESLGREHQGVEIELVQVL